MVYYLNVDVHNSVMQAAVILKELRAKLEAEGYKVPTRGAYGNPQVPLLVRLGYVIAELEGLKRDTQPVQWDVAYEDPVEFPKRAPALGEIETQQLEMSLSNAEGQVV